MKNKISTGKILKKPSRIEELELLKKIKQGDRDAQEKFMKMNQGLVVSIARRYAFSNDILEDLISEGNIGLIEAIKKFDPKKHARFGTYAYFWVRRYIMRAMSTSSFKVPEKIKKLKTKYKNVIEKVKLEENRCPTNTEMASLLKLDVPTFLKYKPYFESTKISPFFQDSENEDYDLFDITNFTSSKKQWDSILVDKDILNKLFRRLQKKIKSGSIDIWLKALKLHYGIDDGIPRSYKEIAEQMGFSRQRVHQIIKTCLKHLHNEIKEMKNERII
ncbi:MAG TPA: sigma-70 family RNA polymerase sigma factor [bacterium]|nr:sigma-70 family RNA polymerase sigma factor [bacterium]HOL48942.1 sigma-70 family RNA polymerase sigma factor [bacterium]HPO51223.1 sigma-70 family RNA polymerase sigma factor [bacterium]HXK44863.1 sigma-70 family RNA polymerase sigma factor [bacterium]